MSLPEFPCPHGVRASAARWPIRSLPGTRAAAFKLLLEPSDHPAVKPYRDALVEPGIPLEQLAVEDVGAEHARRTKLGVVFTQPPVTSTFLQGHALRGIVGIASCCSNTQCQRSTTHGMPSGREARRVGMTSGWSAG